MKDSIMKGLGSLGGLSGKLYGWSDEHQEFYSSGYRCPQCQKRLLNGIGAVTINLYSAAGEELPLWKMNRADVSECPSCLHRWKVKSSGEPVAAREMHIVEIQETDREEEGIGSDKRVIDNSRSSARLERKFSLSKEWSKSYRVEYEKAHTSTGGVSVGLDDAVSLKAGLELAIKNRYSVSEESREICSEEVMVQVPGKTRLSVVFEWKRIWQCGLIRFRDQDGRDSQVPFRIAVGVTFDQLQIDE